MGVGGRGGGAGGGGRGCHWGAGVTVFDRVGWALRGRGGGVGGGGLGGYWRGFCCRGVGFVGLGGGVGFLAMDTPGRVGRGWVVWWTTARFSC